MPHARHRSLTGLVAMALGTAALAQTTWVVDANNGLGTNFLDLPPAVAASSSGDHIIVRSSSSTTYTAPPTIQHGLTLRGESGAVRISGPIRVAGLAAAEPFVVQDLQLNYGLEFRQCGGNIHVEHCPLGGLVFEDCPLAVLVDVSVRFSPGALFATRSRVVMDGSRFGSHWAAFGAGLATLTLTDSELWAARTRIDSPIGESFASPWTPTICTTYLGWAMPAIVATRSTVTLGQGCVVDGSYWRGPCIGTSFGSAIQTGGVPVATDPSVTIFGGSAAPLVQRHYPDALAEDLARGRTANITIVTTPGALGLLFVGLSLPVPVSLPPGDLFCDPNTATLVAIGNTGASGSFGTTLPISVNLPVGSLVVVQGVTASPQGQIAVSFPACRVVR